MDMLILNSKFSFDLLFHSFGWEDWLILGIICILFVLFVCIDFLVALCSIVGAAIMAVVLFNLLGQRTEIALDDDTWARPLFQTESLGCDTWRASNLYGDWWFVCDLSIDPLGQTHRSVNLSWPNGLPEHYEQFTAHIKEIRPHTCESGSCLVVRVLKSENEAPLPDHEVVAFIKMLSDEFLRSLNAEPFTLSHDFKRR
ncbi:hypothetical protein AB6D11_02505 [Vibrio splendidus]